MLVSKIPRRLAFFRRIHYYLYHTNHEEKGKNEAHNFGINLDISRGFGRDIIGATPAA